MAKQTKIRKTNGSAAKSNRDKRVAVSGRLRRPTAAPAVANHFLPKVEQGKRFSVFDLADHLAETEQWTPDRLAATQLRQARELIRYAQKKSPFYKDRLANTVAASASGLTPNVFAAIPILTRAEVQIAKDALFCSQLPRGHGPAFDLHTTGSSGQPVHVRSTKFSSLFNMAATLRGHRWFARDLAGTNVTIKVESVALEQREFASPEPGLRGDQVASRDSRGG